MEGGIINRSHPLQHPHGFHHHATGIFCSLPFTCFFCMRSQKGCLLPVTENRWTVRQQETVPGSFSWRYPLITPGHIISSGKTQRSFLPHEHPVREQCYHSVDIRARSKERDLGSRRAGVRRFNSCSTHWFFRDCLYPARPPLCRISGTARMQ
jgi:hypothetical protein